MDYRMIDHSVIVRLDPEEKIVESLKAVCEAEKIRLAEVAGLGALKEFTVGLYDLEKKEFSSRTFAFPSEITSLWGTVTTQDGAFYAHIHMSAADAEQQVYGGHLSEATVSATAELVIRVLNGRVEREYSGELGLNLMKFL